MSRRFRRCRGRSASRLGQSLRAGRATLEDVIAVERELVWEAIPPGPPDLEPLIARAGQALVSDVRDHDPGALTNLSRALDEARCHPAFAAASESFQVAVLNRSGVAHNWLAARQLNEGAAGARGPGRHASRDPRGDVPGADFDRAVGIFRGAIAEHPTHHDAWRLWTNLSFTLTGRYQRAGTQADLDEAVSAAREAVRLSEDRVGRALAHSALANALTVRHRLLGSTDDLDTAVQESRAAIAACPDGRRRTALHYELSGVLATRYDTRGGLSDLVEAEKLLRDALEAPEAPQVPRDAIHGQLGTLLRRRFVREGRPELLDEAIEHLQVGLHVETPARLTNLGNAYLTRFELRGDPADLDRAIARQRDSVAATPAGDWQLASRHNNLGNALSNAALVRGDARAGQAAVDAYRHSLALTEPSAPERASREYNLATALVAITSDNRSGPLAAECTSLFRAAVRHGLLGSLEWSLGAARAWGHWAASAEQWGEAAEAFLASIEAGRRLFRIQLARGQQETWLRDLQGIPGEAAHALARAGRPTEAVLALERGRSLLLSDALGRDRADLTALSSAAPALASQYRARAEALANAMQGDIDAESVRRARHNLDDVRTRIRAVDGFGHFLAEPTYAEVVHAVPPGTVLVYLAPAVAGGVALLVENGAPPVPVLLPRCTVQACRSRVAALLRRRAGGDPETGVFAGLLDAVTRWLWDAVLGPVLAETGPGRRLHLVPGGLLALMPLHAAYTERDGRRHHADEEAVLSYISGVSALTSCAAVASGARLAKGLVVVDPRPTSAKPIGYGPAEAAWAATADEVTVLPGERATASAFLTEATTADLIHLACHGSSSPDQPLNSGLLLAGDVRLTLEELLRTRLRGSAAATFADSGARIVVLSACDTDQPGVALPDEAISLPSALIQTGAAAVIASQWPVRNLAVCLLTAAFQAMWRLQGKDPPEALAAAQRWLRETTNAEMITHLEDWHRAFGVNGCAHHRRDVIRALALRQPLAREFTSVAAWGALSYHGV